MTKLEQAARRALEALEEAYENGFLTGVTGLKTIDTITALREALAEPDIEEMTLTQIAAKHEQAAKKSVERHVENVYERGDKYFAWIGDNYVQIYTAPVRTKDLTVDEKVALADRLNLNGRIVVIDAVIAADREKNK